jgi:hypothetical protein
LFTPQTKHRTSITKVQAAAKPLPTWISPKEVPRMENLYQK